MEKHMFKLIVIHAKRIAFKKAPILYSATNVCDTIVDVEEFFENMSEEVSVIDVERIASELNQNGYSYYNDYAFSLI